MLELDKMIEHYDWQLIRNEHDPEAWRTVTATHVSTRCRKCHCAAHLTTREDGTFQTRGPAFGEVCNPQKRGVKV